MSARQDPRAARTTAVRIRMASLPWYGPEGAVLRTLAPPWEVRNEHRANEEPRLGRGGAPRVRRLRARRLRRHDHHVLDLAELPGIEDVQLERAGSRRPQLVARRRLR